MSDNRTAGFDFLVNNGTGVAQSTQNQSVGTFFTSLFVGLVFGIAQIVGFILIKDRLPSVYQPKTFLVAPREQTTPLSPGPWQWIKPIFRRTDGELLRKCGLDAYFISRYLIVLLKIFCPMALILLPVLLPINATGGNNLQVEKGFNATKGLDVLTVSNLQPKYYTRLWAHTVLSILVVVWTGCVMYQELRNFIRVRQSFLTTPQYRLRASASTVLVQTVPGKFLDRDELEALFDVYPGGIRNIWINRDYSTLDDLVKERNKIARKLERAELELIRLCWQKRQKPLKSSNSTAQLDGHGTMMQASDVTEDGPSANNPHQVHHNVDDAVADIQEEEELENPTRQRFFGRGLDAVAHGFHNVGQGLGNLGAGLHNTGDDNLRRFNSVRRLLGRGQDERYSGNKDVEEARESQDNTSPAVAVEKPSSEDSMAERKKPLPYDETYDCDKNLNPRWKQFIEEKDRPTMRASIKWSWCPAWINPRATKVDSIWYCRRELARMNKQIEELQRPSQEHKFPIMTSAFIQFNNQAAAHMACQSLAHHVPKYMAPRLVEIAPNDILWQNMSISWWARYLRRAGITIVVTGLTFLWAIPIAALSALSQVDVLRNSVGFLAFLKYWPRIIIMVIQGAVSPLGILGLIVLLGFLLRILVRFSGTPTNTQVEASVQKYYFIFTFIQYFLVVTISSALSAVSKIVKTAADGDIQAWDVPLLLAKNVPTASNYFLSNILIQSCSQAAANLMQPGALFILLVWAPFISKVCRDKFKWRTRHRRMDWGTTYPMYTTMACIAFIYSVISPLIIPLSIIGFFIWWISTKYRMLYVYRYRLDGGGLLFPSAVMQLFTGIYVMQVVLLGYVVLVSTSGIRSDEEKTDRRGKINTKAVAPLIIVIGITIVLTMVLHRILRSSFDPLLKYLPITLEDAAVERDEEFARLLEQRHNPNPRVDSSPSRPELSSQNWRRQSMFRAGSRDRLNPPDVERDRSRGRGLSPRAPQLETSPPVESSTRNIQNKRTDTQLDSEKMAPDQRESEQEPFGPPESDENTFVQQPASPIPTSDPTPHSNSTKRANIRNLVASNLTRPVDILSRPLNVVLPSPSALEAAQSARSKEARELYGGIPDDLEALTATQRDALVSRAFRHRALRAKRPCVWIPRDEMGVADDEVANTAKFTAWVWISAERQRIVSDGRWWNRWRGRGRLLYRGAPPDFDEVDLIQL